MIVCPSCNKQIDDNVNFCSYCGNEIKPVDTRLKTGKKIKIYLLSFILSPLGLIWFFRYIKDENKENKKVAYISLILTMLPILLSLLFGNKIYKLLLNTSLDYKNTLDSYYELLQ